MRQALTQYAVLVAIPLAMAPVECAAAAGVLGGVFLVSLMPIGVNLVRRLGSVRWVIIEEGRLLSYNIAGLVLFGGQLLTVYLVLLRPTRGEVMQLHGPS
jgi:hypothetical protein